MKRGETRATTEGELRAIELVCVCVCVHKQEIKMLKGKINAHLLSFARSPPNSLTNPQLQHKDIFKNNLIN